MNTRVWITPKGEMVEASYYEVLDGDFREATPAEAWVFGEIRKLSERVATLEAAKVGEGEAA